MVRIDDSGDPEIQPTRWWEYEDANVAREQARQKLAQVGQTIAPMVESGDFAGARQAVQNAAKPAGDPIGGWLQKRVKTALSERWQGPQEPAPTPYTGNRIYIDETPGAKSSTVAPGPQRFDPNASYPEGTPEDKAANHPHPPSLLDRAGDIASGVKGYFDRVNRRAAENQGSNFVEDLGHAMSGNQQIRVLSGKDPSELPGPLPDVTDALASPANLMGMGIGSTGVKAVGAELAKKWAAQMVAGVSAIEAQKATDKGLTSYADTNLPGADIAGSPVTRTVAGLGAAALAGVGGYKAAEAAPDMVKGLHDKAVALDARINEPAGAAIGEPVAAGMTRQAAPQSDEFKAALRPNTLREIERTGVSIDAVEATAAAIAKLDGTAITPAHIGEALFYESEGGIPKVAAAQRAHLEMLNANESGALPHAIPNAESALARTEAVQRALTEAGTAAVKKGRAASLPEVSFTGERGRGRIAMFDWEFGPGVKYGDVVDTPFGRMQVTDVRYSSDGTSNVFGAPNTLLGKLEKTNSKAGLSKTDQIIVRSHAPDPETYAAAKARVEANNLAVKEPDNLALLDASWEPVAENGKVVRWESPTGHTIEMQPDGTWSASITNREPDPSGSTFSTDVVRQYQGATARDVAEQMWQASRDRQAGLFEPSVPPDTTGLAGLGNLGQGIADSYYDMLLERSKTPEGRAYLRTMGKAEQAAAMAGERGITDLNEIKRIAQAAEAGQSPSEIFARAPIPPPDTAVGSAPDLAAPESAPPLSENVPPGGGDVPPPLDTSPGQSGANTPPPPPPGGTTASGDAPLPKVQVGPFELPDITPTPLSKADIAMNAVKRALGGDRYLEDPIATPAMRARAQAKPIIDSQAARLGATAKQVVDSAFPNMDANGRVTDLPGQPTIQTIAARLPDFAPHLSPKQLDAMDYLRTEVAPYRDLLEQVGVDVHSRADVTDGGFYLPRGRADLEGADAPVKVASGRSGGVGGKKGFEKGAVFDSMEQGIDAGYRYAPIEEALQSYAKEAGNRAMDSHIANYFKSVTDGEGNPIGQTVNARLLAQNPGIAAKVEGLRKSLASLKGTTDRLTEKQQAVIDEFLNSPAPDLEALREALDTRVGLSAVGKAGPNFGKTPAELRQAIRDTRAQIADLMPDWKRAQERSRQTPREQGSIGIAQLNGTTFPDEVANAANKWIEKERPATGQGAALLHTVAAFNGLMRGLRATGDASFMAIQGLMGAPRSPRAYARATALAFEGMAHPQALGRYIIEYDKRALAEGLPTSKELIANGLHIGGADTEFSVKGGIPGLNKKIQNAPVIRQTNTAFGYYGDVLRMELARTAYASGVKNGIEMTPKRIGEVTRAANLATGWSPRKFGGDLGEVGEFAPRFFQSQLEFVAHGLTDWHSLTGTEARRMTASLVGSAAMLTAGVNFYNEQTGKPFVPWDQLFDPRSSNFMRMRIAGQDVSPLGPWDSLAKGFTQLGEGFASAGKDVAQGDFEDIPGDALSGVNYFARSKASPGLAAIWDLASGKDFTGQNTRNADWFIRSILPMSLSDVGKKSPAAIAVGMTGLKSTPLTPTEELDQLAKSQFGAGGFYDLLRSQQEQLKSEHPDLWQRALERGSSARQQYEGVKQQLTAQQEGSDKQLLSGQMKREDWLKQYDDRKTKLAGAQLAIYGNKPITNPRNASDRYAQILQQNQDPTTGAYNWDAVDAAVARLSPADQRWIEDSQSVGNTALVTAYKQAAKLRGDYFNLSPYRGYTADEAQQIDDLWTQVRANSRNTEPAMMLATLRKLTASQPVDSRILTGVRRRILGLLTQTTDRQKFAKAHPEMGVFFGGGGKAGRLTPDEIALARRMAGR